MAVKVTLRNQPELDADQVAALLRERVGEKYTVEPGPTDCWRVRESAVKGANLKVKPRPGTGETTVTIWGSVPSTEIRILAALCFVVPLIYMQLVGSRSVVQDVERMLTAAA
jgi:hypothetical protein